MQLFGNLLTHYHYEHSRFHLQRTAQKYEIRVNRICDLRRSDRHTEQEIARERFC